MDRDTTIIITALRKHAPLRPYIRRMTPAFILVRPLRVIAAHPESTDHEKSWGLPALQNLITACNTTLQRPDDRGYVLAPGARKLAEGLVEDVCNYAMKAATERRVRRAMWAYLAALYWLEKATDDNPDLLPPEGPLYDAIAALLEAHNRHLDIAAEMDNSARGGAKRLAAAFDRIELFPLGQAVKVAA